jgi:hypothetical protein
MSLTLKSVADYPNPGLPTDLHGWNSDSPVFDQVIAEAKPTTIIEVGTWKGRSALHMAELAPQARVICVDTWLGSGEHLHTVEPKCFIPRDDYGYPNLYHVFLSNLHGKPEASRIFPVAASSTTAAQVFRTLGIKSELIYIDGEHTHRAVFADISSYWPLLAPGGIMFGDDFSEYPGVFCDVHRFAHDHRLSIEVQDPFWIARKPRQ